MKQSAVERAKQFGWTDEIKEDWLKEVESVYPFTIKSGVRLSASYANAFFNCDRVVVIRGSYFYLFTESSARDNLAQFLRDGGAEPDILSMLELQKTKAYHA